MAAFTYQIITPDGSLASGVCDSLVLPTSRGEVGILANHAPLLADIVSGELRIRQAGATQRFHVSRGVVEVAANAATLLVEEAVTKIGEVSPAGTPALPSADSDELVTDATPA